MISTPLTVDEGGYGYVARLWSRGVPLYRTAWVDRPQGLLWMYRAAFSLFGDSAQTIRGLAAATAAGTVGAISAIGRRFIGSDRGGLFAGALYATLSAIPQFEGHTANGELLCALPSAISILFLMRALDAPTTKQQFRSMFYAGIFGAAGMLVKQSAYDVVLVGGVVICVVAWHKRGTGHHTFAQNAIGFGLGGLMMMIPAVVHGYFIGFSDWWFAFAGYRLGVESVMSGGLDERYGRFVASIFLIGINGLTLFVFAGLGLLAFREGRTRRLIPLGWFICALSSFALGGLFHTHYYIGLVAPISVLGAQGLSELLHEHRLGRFNVARVIAVPMCALFLAPALWSTWTVLRESSADRRSLLSSHDDRLIRNAKLATWITAHSNETDTIYVVYADAALYYEADRQSALKFLWERGVERIPGAMTTLTEVLNGPDAPRYVLQMTLPGKLRGGKPIKEIIERRYKDVATVDGIIIRELKAQAG
jgi:4-amino-4-deoxy-L-arabinose transferase-like glycosyltransferase